MQLDAPESPTLTFCAFALRQSMEEAPLPWILRDERTFSDRRCTPEAPDAWIETSSNIPSMFRWPLPESSAFTTGASMPNFALAAPEASMRISPKRPVRPASTAPLREMTAADADSDNPLALDAPLMSRRKGRSLRVGKSPSALRTAAPLMETLSSLGIRTTATTAPEFSEDSLFSMARGICFILRTSWFCSTSTEMYGSR